VKRTAKGIFVLMGLTILTYSDLSGQLLKKKGDVYTVEGQVIDLEGDGVGNIEVNLLDSEGKNVGSETTKKRIGKGSFEFKKIVPGNYTVSASGEVGEASQELIVKDENLVLELTLGAEPTEQKSSIATDRGTVGEGTTSARMPQEEYVMTEISFELKKMAAELDHLSGQVRDLQARSEMWINPLSIYQKEIILDNGSTVFGKVVYQDEDILKVESLVGYLVIDRSTVVRIVENVMSQEEQEYVPEQIRESYSPPPMPKLAEPRYVSADASNRASSRDRVANIVLVGNIAEKTDRSNNKTLSGQVKNVGGNRADFVKVNFVLRKNWSGETRTLTTFVGGSYHTFDSGITTDSSLLPGATGNFELIIPSDIGSFLGYSYTIDWEEYE
tara:strand:+ start:8 stop:1165 length:1158 start_codon:yes stop_codon:yes gene_type:complete